MTRIAYVIDHLRMGGAQRHLLQVVQGLDPERYSFEMWTAAADPGELAADFEKLGVPVRSFGIRSTMMSLATASAVRRVARDLQTRNVPIVQGYLFEGNFLAAMVGRLSRRPVTLVSKRSLDRYTRLDHRIAAWLSNRFADRVTVNAIAVRNIVLEHERCSPSKIELIPNGVPLPSAYAPRPAPEAEPDPRGDGPLVGMVGRLGWKKGYEFALEAFALVRERIPNLRVDIDGDGTLRSELESLSKKLGLESTVRFLGQRDDVATRMRTFDCYVLSSVIEGMPNALLEAMAASCPVVTTSAGGSAEIVEHGESGLVVPTRDAPALAKAIERVLTEEILAERLRRGGSIRARRDFSLDAMLQALDKLYRRELARAGLTPSNSSVERGRGGQSPGEAGRS